MVVAYGEESPHTTARAWTVERARIVCTAAPACPDPVGVNADRAPVRAAALAHLALHARAETLPDHLRTCRCHAHGCSWHGRHRGGCSGPIRLVLFRRSAGRLWSLADVCTGCAQAIPYAATVTAGTLPPDVPLGGVVSTAGAGTVSTVRKAVEPSGEERAAVRAALLYLAAALGDRAPAPVRVLALLCLLRADRSGAVRLPRGLPTYPGPSPSVQYGPCRSNAPRSAVMAAPAPKYSGSSSKATRVPEPGGQG